MTVKKIILRSAAALFISAALIIGITVFFTGPFHELYAKNEPMNVDVIGGDEIAYDTNSSGENLDKLYFFGDSTTYGLLKYNVNNDGTHGENYHTLRASQIWVPEGGTFYLGNILSAEIALQDGRKLTLGDAAAAVKPEYLVITVGINGLTGWNEETFTKYYEKMLSLVQQGSPETIMILQSVYPSAENTEGKLAAFTNDKIDRLNSWIEKIAQKHGLSYIDSSQALKDSRGYLKVEYQNGDGLHLNTLGFNAILEYIDKNYDRWCK